MMRLQITIYLISQNNPEIEINHSHNTGVINLFLRNCRHYKELQKHQEDGDNEKFYTLKDLKIFNDYNDVISSIKRKKRSKERWIC